MGQTLSRQNVLHEIKAYIIISLGLFIYSFGWIGILLPAEAIGGGITGVSQLIYFATSNGGEGGIPIGYSFFVINAVLVAIAMFVIGPTFGTKTIYAMVFNSLALWFLQENVPPNIVGLHDDKLLSSILGGALSGSGIALCFWQGGSTGGTDIIAMIVHKYRNVSLGQVIMFCDIFIIGSSYFVFHSITTIIYGYVTIFAAGYTVDMLMQGNRQSCQLIIISSLYEQIKERVISSAHRGVTMLHGEGGYTEKSTKILMVFCRKNEAPEIYRLVKEIDSNAFISNASVSNIYGNGFDNLKLRNKKKREKQRDINQVN